MLWTIRLITQKYEEALSVWAVNSHPPAYECISCVDEKQYVQIKKSYPPATC